MGTRADFYVAREEGLDWRGSIAWDGYPEGIDEAVLAATNEPAFEVALASLAKDRSDGDWTSPAQGWPWPWVDSKTTDFAYVLIDGQGVVFSSFGGHTYWANRRSREDDDYERAHVALIFPNMTDRQAVAGGSRSGAIIVGG